MSAYESFPTQRRSSNTGWHAGTSEATICRTGMFDYYEPVPAPLCPWSSAPFKVWQGTDGSNALLGVWRQGDLNPIDQPVVEESRIDPSDYVKYRLPDVFRITGWCVNEHRAEATGRSVDGVWRKFDLDEDDLRRAAEQRERDRIERLRESWRPT